VGLDVARALAVFGMFGAHVGVVADDVGVSPSTWTGVVNGRSSILFAVLAGCSVALLSGGTTPVAGDDLVRARMRIFVRAAWVFAIGGVLEALGTGIEVILGVYAMLFVLVLPFLRWSPRRLLLAAGALALLAPPVALVAEEFVEASDSYDAPFVLLAVTGTYPAVIWSTFILVGLAVGRCDLRSRRIRTALRSLGVGLAVIGYGGGWVSSQWLAGGPEDRDGGREHRGPGLVGRCGSAQRYDLRDRGLGRRRAGRPRGVSGRRRSTPHGRPPPCGRGVHATHRVRRQRRRRLGYRHAPLRRQRTMAGLRVGSPGDLHGMAPGPWGRSPRTAVDLELHSGSDAGHGSPTGQATSAPDPRDVVG
jgi:hypothetical protein